jgi:ribonuclease HI
MTESLFAGLDSPTPKAASWHTAHCDGGSRGNPGPSGYGAVIEDTHGNVVARLSGYLGHQTNNYAEYQGLLAVLNWAMENDAKRLRVVSDSELMVKQMKGQYKVASPVLRPLWEKAKQLSKSLERFEMRHTLRGGNQEADRLANEAMDKGMGRQSGDSGSPSSGVAAPRHAGLNPREKSQSAAKPPTQVFEGYVKNGVVHLLEGDLPEGTFVKVMRK